MNVQIYLFFFLFVCNFTLLRSDLVKSQYEALKSLYDSTDGDNWFFRSNFAGLKWNFSDPSSDPCSASWQGVTCSKGPGNQFVTSLDLSAYRLNGSLPRDIFYNLSKELTKVDLSRNQIKGFIPDLKNLTYLETLHVSGNNLIGSIPKSIGDISNLVELNVFNNELSGTIPESIGNLSNLKILYLFDNFLNGTIPDSISKLSKLTDLYLYRNTISGTIPNSIGNLSNLVVLFLYDNYLNGTIPLSIGNLSNLTNLNLNENHLTGTIPDSIGNLSNLRLLLLFNNSLNGTIPEPIGKLSNLATLYLMNNDLSGTIPESVGNLSNLRLLYFTKNSLSGTIPSSIGKLSNLRDLYLTNNSLSGTIPSSICNLSNLSTLYLSNNALNGSIPYSIGNLSSLVLLALYNNYLSGTIPESIGNLSRLLYLEFFNNYFSGTIPETIGKLSNLLYLQLSNNYLSGTVLETICNFPFLWNLELSNNDLYGTIPESIGNLSNLRYLYLSNNHLSGSIPSSIGDLSNLITLDLSFNMLVSALPKEIGKLNILHVFLQQNKLSGLIAPLTSSVLEVYDVRSNEFTGQIPSSLFTLKSLKSLSVSDNCLSTDLSHIIDCELSSTIEELFLVGIGQNTRCKLQSNSMLFYAPHSIPDCFWRMQSLKQLFISGNGLKGNLDAFNLTNISELSISNNRLSGTLPSFFQSYRSLKMFDIADNRFEGYLDVNIVSTGDPGNTIKADVNRFSGRINTNTVGTFDYINVLTGNLISCATLPAEDSGLDTYVCETRDLAVAVVVWCVVCACFLILFALRFNPWCELCSFEWIDYPQNLIYFHTKLSDHVKQSIPLSVQFIHDLFKLLKLSFFIFSALILVTITLYSGFKLGEGSEKFKSHSDQYLYLVSGVYLRSAGPACTLFVVYVVFFVFLVFVLNRLFVVDSLTRLNILLFSDKVDDFVDVNFNTKSLLTKSIYRGIACLIFFGVSLVFNGLYIIAINRLNGIKLVFVQITYSLFNILYQTFGIPLLFEYIFPMQHGHNSSSSLVYTILLILVKIINPFVAIIFTDDLCFRQLLFSKQTVSVSYDVSRCAILNTDTQRCVNYIYEEVTYTLPLPFIFSDQCRNAMFRNYIPPILYSCAYSTFIEPIFFLRSTYNIKSLNEVLSIFRFKSSMHMWVLYDVTYSFVAIIVELMLLLFYGIVSPFCAVALWASTASRILLLRLQVYRYYLLQIKDTSEIDSVVTHDKYHIEVMCGNALKYTHIFIQPIFLLSLIFGLFLFEMAYDGEKGSVTVSICLIVLMTCITLIAQSLIFWSRRARLVSTQRNVQLELGNDKKNVDLELELELKLSLDSSDCKSETFVKSPLYDL